MGAFKDSPKKPGAKDGLIGLSKSDIIIGIKICIKIYLEFC